MKPDGPLLIGIGNPDRGDDAIGLDVVEHLAREARVLRSLGDPAGLIAAWGDEAWVVLIDAVSTGAPAGTILVRELLEDPLPKGGLHSTHALGPVEAIEIGRALEVIPDRVTLVGIECAAVCVAGEMSTAVAEARAEAVTVIRSILDQPAHGLWSDEAELQAGVSWEGVDSSTGAATPGSVNSKTLRPSS